LWWSTTPTAWTRPIDSWWSFHAGGGVFKDLDLFTEALDRRYGPAKSLEEYTQKAQVLAYEGHRAMFEAFGRNKYTSTGVIGWMLNNAWPSMIWHLYDWYLRPGGSYFGAKKACEPLHVQYSYDDASVVIVNSFYTAFPSMKVTARVYNLDMTIKFVKETWADLTPDSSTRVLTVPQIEGLSTAYFLHLTLNDASGALVSSNFYWLSTKPDELEWQNGDWYHTPTKSFAAMDSLNTLPQVELRLASASEVRAADGLTRVTVENPNRSLAFAVRLKVNRSTDGEEILPVLWQDNYFSLLPGEKREVTATYSANDLGKATPVVEVEGWNVRRLVTQ
jgi:exo-1,4-beta-D-glucosaminidase